MKKFLPWCGLASVVILVLMGAKWVGDAYKADARQAELKRIDDEVEITRKEYSALLIKSLKYGSFKFLIYDKLYSDSKITKKELKELNETYDRISMHDHIHLILQEKGIQEDEDGK